MDKAGGVNQVIFTLPAMPISKNKLYGPEPRTVHSNQLTWGPTAAAKQWRSEMQRYVKLLRISPGSGVRIDLHFYFNRYLKDGVTRRRVDVANFIDWTIDTVAQKQDWDDHLVERGSWSCSHDKDRPRVAVRLTEVVSNGSNNQLAR